jgi:hypothetical protein
LRLKKTLLKADNIVTELVVFLLEELVVIRKCLILFDLVLELSDILLFTLAERSL